MINKIFENLTVTSGTKSSASSWIALPESFHGHSVAGKFHGNGVMSVSYEIAPIESAEWAADQGNLIQGYTVASGKGVFYVNLITRPAPFIRFYVEETGGVSDLENVHLILTQMGK